MHRLYAIKRLEHPGILVLERLSWNQSPPPGLRDDCIWRVVISTMKKLKSSKGIESVCGGE